MIRYKMELLIDLDRPSDDYGAIQRSIAEAIDAWTENNYIGGVDDPAILLRIKVARVDQVLRDEVVAYQSAFYRQEAE